MWMRIEMSQTAPSPLGHLGNGGNIMELKLNSENFEKEVLNSNEPVLVDFYADWCGPCNAMAPVIEELAKELEGKVKVGKINVDENPDIAVEYNVMSIPTLIVFKNGKEEKRLVGLRNKEELINLF